MKDDIGQRLETNLLRVKSLVDLYDSRGEGKGRRTVADSDLLRAAVVLLHASIEDVVRSVTEWKLPDAPPEKLEGIALVNVDTEKFELKDLAAHRGKTVEDVIRASVVEDLERSNYNHPGQIKNALDRVGLSRAIVDPVQDQLGPMMKRRHWIVHRADRQDSAGSGHHAARTLKRQTVMTRVDAIEQLGRDILEAC